jgi:hypothetical protein
MSSFWLNCEVLTDQVAAFRMSAIWNITAFGVVEGCDGVAEGKQESWAAAHPSPKI